MTMFIITTIAMTLTMGLFIGGMFTSGMKNSTVRLVVTLVIAFVVGIGIAGLFTLESKMDEEQYNDGTCVYCDGNYKLTSVNHVKNGGELYYYSCDNCGDVIRTHRNMK